MNVFLLNRSLSSTKIVQGECKRVTLFAEPQPIFYKDKENYYQHFQFCLKLYWQKVGEPVALVPAKCGI